LASQEEYPLWPLFEGVRHISDSVAFARHNLPAVFAKKHNRVIALNLFSKLAFHLRTLENVNGERGCSSQVQGKANRSRKGARPTCKTREDK